MVRSSEHPAVVWLPRRLVNVAFALVVVASALLCAPAAHAAVTDDVHAVAFGVESVTETATNALPGPLVPVEVPDVPRVPSPPPPASKPPPRAPSPPAATATDAAETAVGDPGGGEGVGEIAGEVARAPSETAAPGASAGPGAGSAPGVPPAAHRPDRRSIGPAEVAPLRQWRAYVWPAIALGVRHALAPLLVRLEGMAGARVPNVFGLLPPSAMPDSVESGPGGSDFPATHAGPPRQPPWIALPAGGMGLLAALVVGLLVVACFVSLARLVVGEELFESRYWRGHRG